MKDETFEQAKLLKEQINRLRSKMHQVDRMRKRPDDEEFNETRELASNAISELINRFERDFNNL